MSLCDLSLVAQSRYQRHTRKKDDQQQQQVLRDSSCPTRRGANAVKRPIGRLEAADVMQPVGRK
jgi:hypothetical protein